jgi:hypothetical protein
MDAGKPHSLPVPETHHFFTAEWQRFFRSLPSNLPAESTGNIRLTRIMKVGASVCNIRGFSDNDGEDRPLSGHCAGV